MSRGSTILSSWSSSTESPFYTIDGSLPTIKLEALHSLRRFPHLVIIPPLSAMPREQLWWWGLAEFNGVVETAYAALRPEGGERPTMGWGSVRMEYFEGEV